MSAIYGIIHFNEKPVALEHPKLMAETLQHWNSDGHFTYQKDNIALGLVHTQVSPESAYEKQPLKYKDWLIVMAGRFFQREALILDLGLPPDDYSKTPDSFLLGKAYEKWDKDCVKHLLGEFTFFIWDSTKKEAFAASDHLAQFPLLYYWQNQTLAFATCLNAIHALPFVNNEKDQLFELELILSPFSSQIEDTPFKDINILPIAHTIKWSQTSKETKQYWEPKFKGYRKTSIEETAKDMLALIDKCIADRIRTNYPVLSTLSGGLDSSTITCIAAKQFATQGRTLFASGFVVPKERYDKKADESEYMQAVVNQESNISFEPTSPAMPSLEKVLAIAEKNMQPPELKPNYWEELAQAAALKKARVVLTGMSGDDIISRKPRNHTAELIRLGKWKMAWQLCRQLNKQHGNISQWSATKTFLKALQLAYPKLIWFSNKHQYDNNWYARTLLAFVRPQYHRAVTKILTQRAEGFDSLNTWRTVDGIKLMLNKSHNIINYYCFINLHQKGIVPSHVLTDKRLVEFCLSVPPEQWAPNGWSRGLIRKATINVLPEKVRLRPDKGFILYETQNFYNQYLEEIKSLVQQKIINKDDCILDLHYMCNQLRPFKGYWSSEDYEKFNRILVPLIRKILS